MEREEERVEEREGDMLNSCWELIQNTIISFQISSFYSSIPGFN